MAKWPSCFESPADHQDICQTMIPPELLNNLGVLMLQESRDEDALKNFEEGLGNCDKLLELGNS